MPHVPRQLLQGLHRVADDDDNLRPARQAAQRSGVAHHDAFRSSLDRLTCELVSIESVASNREKQVAGLQAPRIDRHRPDLIVRAARPQLPAHHARDVVGRQPPLRLCRHPFLYDTGELLRRRTSAARTISASSNATVSRPMI